VGLKGSPFSCRDQRADKGSVTDRAISRYGETKKA
jgi:hypothetical protein